MKPFKDIEKLTDIPLAFQEALSEIVGDVDEIKNLNPDQIMRHKTQWEMGDPSWWDTIKSWACNAGFDINDSEKD